MQQILLSYSAEKKCSISAENGERDLFLLRKELEGLDDVLSKKEVVLLSIDNNKLSFSKETISLTIQEPKFLEDFRTGKEEDLMKESFREPFNEKEKINFEVTKPKTISKYFM